MRWYVVRETGRTLYGPAPDTVVPPISRTEFVDSVKDHAPELPGPDPVRDSRVDGPRKDPRPRWPGLAILTMCRALFACRTDRPATKRQAAIWAQEQLPEWSDLIGDALRWRVEPGDVDGVPTFDRTQAFVTHVAQLVVGSA